MLVTRVCGNAVGNCAKDDAAYFLVLQEKISEFVMLIPLGSDIRCIREMDVLGHLRSCPCFVAFLRVFGELL